MDGWPDSQTDDKWRRMHRRERTPPSVFRSVARPSVWRTPASWSGDGWGEAQGTAAGLPVETPLCTVTSVREPLPCPCTWEAGDSLRRPGRAWPVGALRAEGGEGGGQGPGVSWLPRGGAGAAPWVVWVPVLLATLSSLPHANS